jgi:hypothetical protein
MDIIVVLTEDERKLMLPLTKVHRRTLTTRLMNDTDKEYQLLIDCDQLNDDYDTDIAIEGRNAALRSFRLKIIHDYVHNHSHNRGINGAGVQHTDYEKKASPPTVAATSKNKKAVSANGNKVALSKAQRIWANTLPKEQYDRLMTLLSHGKTFRASSNGDSNKTQKQRRKERRNKRNEIIAKFQANHSNIATTTAVAVVAAIGRDNAITSIESSNRYTPLIANNTADYQQRPLSPVSSALQFLLPLTTTSSVSVSSSLSESKRSNVHASLPTQSLDSNNGYISESSLLSLTDETADWHGITHCILVDLDNWVGFFSKLPGSLSKDTFVWYIVTLSIPFLLTCPSCCN